MAKDNFQYLLNRYKTDRLSGQEWQAWVEMIEEEKYKPIIESDIDTYMHNLLFRQTWSCERTKLIWNNILKAVRKDL